MKIRNGFVSNSSSSSFIVKDIYRFDSHSAKGILTEEEINKLEEFGFKPTRLMHSSALEYENEDNKDIWEPLVDKETNTIVIRNFGYCVGCNQDEVIEWLVENNIGFIATVHYGHHTYIFHKNSDHIMVFENFGSLVETYYQNKTWEQIKGQLEICGSPAPYYKIPISKNK